MSLFSDGENTEVFTDFGPQKIIPAENTNQEERNAYAFPAYNGYRLPKNDEALLAKGLFDRYFEEEFITKAKSVCRNAYDVTLDTAYIFEIALSDVLKMSEDEFKSSDKVGKLHTFLHNERTYAYKLSGGQSELEDALYMAALNAAASSEFHLLKQIRINEIFDEMKKEDIVSKTVSEIAKSKGKAKSFKDSSNPAAFVYKSVKDHDFDPKFAQNAMSWYYSVSGGKKLLDGFDIDYESFTESISKDLKSIVSEYTSTVARKEEYDFEYVEKVYALANALKFIESAGAEDARQSDDIIERMWKAHTKNTNYLYEKIRDEVSFNAKDYFNIEAVVDVIKQNIDRYKDNSMEKSLNIITLINRCFCEVPRSDIRWILERYADRNHLIWKEKGSFGKGAMKRIVSLYRDFGGEPEKLNIQSHTHDIFERKRERPRITRDDPAKMYEANSTIRQIQAVAEQIDSIAPEKDKYSRQTRAGEKAIFIIDRTVQKKNRTTAIGHEKDSWTKVVVDDLPGAVKGKEYAGIIRGEKGKHVEVEPGTVNPHSLPG